MFTRFHPDERVKVFPGRVHLIHYPSKSAKSSENSNASTTRPANATGQFGLDLIETENAFTIYAELPGVDKEHVDINIDNGILTIKAEKERKYQEEQSTTVHHVERSYGNMERSVRLPKNVIASEVHASLENGVLEVTVPKRQEEKPAPIKVQLS